MAAAPATTASPDAADGEEAERTNPPDGAHNALFPLYLSVEEPTEIIPNCITHVSIGRNASLMTVTVL